VPQIYALEQFYLGDAFVCGIKDAYGSFFKDGDFTTLEKVKRAQDKTNHRSIKGVVRDLFEFRVKKEGSRYQGQAMAKISIEDIFGTQCGVTIFPDRWEMLQDRIKEICGDKVKFEIGVAIHFSGSSNLYEDNTGIILDKLYNALPIPQKPSELKAKRVSLKRSKEETNSNISSNNTTSLFEEIEEDLILEGAIDFPDGWDENNDWD